jgi:hypothetical protein
MTVAPRCNELEQDHEAGMRKPQLMTPAARAQLTPRDVSVTPACDALQQARSASFITSGAISTACRTSRPMSKTATTSRADERRPRGIVCRRSRS